MSDPREANDCPNGEVCQSCPCAAEDDVCFPGERLRADLARERERAEAAEAWRRGHEIAAPAVEREMDTLRARAERAEAALADLADCIHREDDGLGLRWWYELDGWRKVEPALAAARAVLAAREEGEDDGRRT